ARVGSSSTLATACSAGSPFVTLLLNSETTTANAIAIVANSWLRGDIKHERITQQTPLLRREQMASDTGSTGQLPIRWEIRRS
ncbi:MAG: hypothetical protein KDA92_21625, partial [Planctomycetales bacterium]|nr:hypothetical protein [Planctomycetales bacterium]